MTSREIIAKLPILDENILLEAANQPQLFVEAARYRVAKMRNRAQALARYEVWCSELGLHYRRTKTGGDRRITEGEIKDRIRISKKARFYDTKLQEAFAQEEFSKLLLEALRMRRDAIRVIADARVSEGIREGAEVERIEARRKLINKARDLESRRRKLEVDDDV